MSNHIEVLLHRSQMPATALTRIMAALLDFSLLSALDAAVLYFTLRLLGLRLVRGDLLREGLRSLQWIAGGKP